MYCWPEACVGSDSGLDREKEEKVVSGNWLHGYQAHTKRLEGNWLCVDDRDSSMCKQRPVVSPHLDTNTHTHCTHSHSTMRASTLL